MEALRRRRVRIGVLVGTALAGAAAFAAGPPRGAALAPAPLIAKLEKLARDVAALGRDAEAKELLDVLAMVGDDAKAVGELKKKCEATLAKTKTVQHGLAVAAAAHALHGVAGELTKLLDGLAPNDRGRLAEQILRLDDEQPAAHRFFGDVEEDGRWRRPDDLARRKHAAEISAAITQSCRFEVTIDVRPVQFAPLQAIDPAPQTAARWHGIELDSTMPAERLARILRRTLQLFALSNYVRTGKLDTPTALLRSRDRYLVLPSRESYLRSIELAVAANAETREAADFDRELSGYNDSRGFYVGYSVSEVDWVAALVNLISEWTLSEDDFQACLVAGHLNWLCLAAIGCELPGSVVEEKKGAVVEGVTSDRPRDTPEEKIVRRLADAGLAGARRWFELKALHREDPAWSHSFVDQKAKIVDLDLLKCTFVAQYLQESGRLERTLRLSSMKPPKKGSRAELIEAALPEGLRTFEEEFHHWLLPPGGAIVQRLGATPPEADKLAKDEQQAVDQLNRLRRAAWDEKSLGPCEEVAFDRPTAQACALHVAYLTKNPEQLAKWPDAHEEYADKEGFTPEGCFAGLHSVIAPGVPTAAAAIDEWMATFYHRLPLLESGLKSIGFHLDQGIAVLDAGSLVEPERRKLRIAWPPDGMKGVATHFEPELPNPVPGADQATFGYPITLQTWGEPGEFVLKLVRGTEKKGEEVPCWFSTPGHPTYLDVAPPGVFCLIPKSPLDPGTHYTVVGDAPGGEHFTWSFTTGS